MKKTKREPLPRLKEIVKRKDWNELSARHRLAISYCASGMKTNAIASALNVTPQSAVDWRRK
jgi:transposase